MKHIIASCLLALVAIACDSTPPANAPTTSSGNARPSCDAIDHACDAHENEGGLAKECHDLGEASTTPEAACAAKKDACLAACPPKK